MAGWSQVDLVIDRADHTIHLVEIEFSQGVFTITEDYAAELRSFESGLDLVFEGLARAGAGFGFVCQFVLDPGDAFFRGSERRAPDFLLAIQHSICDRPVTAVKAKDEPGQSHPP